MIKIQIKKVLETDGEPRDKIPVNKYDIIMSIDNQAWQTVQMDININEVREHIRNLLKTIPFAVVEIENPEIWEKNMIGAYINFKAVNTTA